MSDVMASATELLALPDDELVARFSEIDSKSSLEDVVLYGAWLSIRYAVNGNVVPPNTTVIAKAKSQYPTLPGPDLITNVAGGATKVREELGFVTNKLANEWSEQEYIENGRWLSHMLGSPEEPVMPRRDDLELAARLGIGPSKHLIVEKFGNVKNYQDKLGFVNEATLERWTDADWINYGTWLSHTIGTPEKPAQLKSRDFKNAAVLNVGPPLRDIYNKYGSFRKYLECVGTKPERVDYKNWDREMFIENGIWLSHMLGTPESPRMPKYEDIKRWTAVGLVPPKSAIDKKFKRSLSRYQDALGFVTTATLERWTDEDWIDNGKWLVAALREKNRDECTPTVEKLREAADLNLVPKLPFIIKKFGSVMEYQKAIGVQTANHYKLWSKRQVLAYGFRMIHEKEGQSPTAKDYQLADGPGKEVICNRFGTLAKFHERLGIVNYRGFSRTQLISFGVRWAHENKGKILTSDDLSTLSKKREGPGINNIYGSFSTLAEFQNEVNESYESFKQARSEYTSVKTNSEQIFDFLTRDFEDTPEYEAMLSNKLQLVNILRSVMGARIVMLVELFGKSRRTILWDKDDFIYFRSLMGQKLTDDSEAMLEGLHKLDSLGLSPYLDEIEEVFGSLEDFVQDRSFEQTQKAS